MTHIHTFIKSDKEGYEVCSECGSHHSIAQVNPKILYEERPYWGDGTGRSGLPDQCENLLSTDECGISKVDRVLQFIPHGKRCLEIACAPGIMLQKLSERFLEVYGIEPSDKYIDFICKKAPKAKVIHGFFPEVTKPIPDGSFDCIVGMDVMEHTNDDFGFVHECRRLLTRDGVMIMMSPIILHDGLVKDSDFIPDAHCWIHTQKFLEPCLKEMFREVKFTRWVVGHELIICKK
jgi:2-polyprenyl-3-methyl-5-hydroxy-6-metoxy-1,4-benzoquinol methylase